MVAATGNKRRPAVDRRYCGICSCSVNDDRRWRRPDMLNTETSLFRYDDAIPFNTWYAISASLNWPVLANTASTVSQVRQTRGHSDEIGISNELRRRVHTVDVIEDGQEAQQTRSCYNRARIEPRVDERDHEKTKAVVVDLTTYMTKQSQCCETARHGSTYTRGGAQGRCR